MQIGFFDSGIGGVSVLHAARKLMPQEDYIYYADLAHVPYGSKAKAEVQGHVFNAIDFLAGQNVKAVVVACNTATSVAIGALRARHSIPILGMEPAVKPAVENLDTTGKRILVTATALTVREEKLQNLIARFDQDHCVDALPLPGLVDFAERLEFGEQTVLPYLEQALTGLDRRQYATVVLGCTHFPFFRDSFRRLFPDAQIIDGSAGTATNLRRILHQQDRLEQNAGKIDYYHSGIKVETAAGLATYRRLFSRLDELES